MFSGEITSSGRLALPTHPPEISKKRRGRRRMERQTGGWGGQEGWKDRYSANYHG